MNQNLIIYSEAIPTNSTAQNIYNANNFQSTEKTTNSTNQQKNYQLQKTEKYANKIPILQMENAWKITHSNV